MTGPSYVMSGPWTSHGHAIPGVTKGADRPASRARCGGPGICTDCSREAAAAQNAREVSQPEPGVTFAASFQQQSGEYLTIDGKVFPWFIHEDGCRIEPLAGDSDMAVLWVPVLIDAPCPQLGKPDAPLLTEATQ